MFTALFWNLNGKKLEQNCARLAHLHQATVLVLAECTLPGVVLKALNPKGQPAKYYLARDKSPDNKNGSRVRVFTRFGPSQVELVTSSWRYTIHALFPNTPNELLLCSVHLSSKSTMGGKDDRSQDNEIADLSQSIANIENDEKRKHTRTILIGDLNAHPFQYGVYATRGLHAVSSREVARRGIRKVSGKNYRFFYNPMWRFLGDIGPHRPGTFYRSKAEDDCLFWSTYDQVLIRPVLLPYFRDENLAILTNDGETSLADDRERPDRKNASDHFPIKIGLDYPGTNDEQHNS
jgi:hypothetical protein